MEKYDQKKLSLSDKFGMLLSGLDTYFLQLGARFPSNVATKAFFGGKKFQTLAILDCFSGTKTEECNQKE